MARPGHRVLLADSPPGGSQEPILFTSPGISQAHSPSSRLLFFLIKVARARIPSQKGQPCVWMSSSRLCHCCARLHWQLDAGAHETQWREVCQGPDPLRLSLQVSLLPPSPLWVCVLVPQLCLTLCDPMDREVHCPWDSLGKNTGVGCHSLLQVIFPTQGSNQCLLHFRQILYCEATREASSPLASCKPSPLPNLTGPSTLPPAMWSGCQHWAPGCNPDFLGSHSAGSPSPHSRSSRCICAQGVLVDPSLLQGSLWVCCGVLGWTKHDLRKAPTLGVSNLNWEGAGPTG